MAEISAVGVCGFSKNKRGNNKSQAAHCSPVMCQGQGRCQDLRTQQSADGSLPRRSGLPVGELALGRGGRVTRPPELTTLVPLGSHPWPLVGCGPCVFLSQLFPHCGPMACLFDT